MSNRTAIIASAFIAGCASIISITSIQVRPALAADECLTAPKAATPAGGHWYYRLEKGTKRKCWYLSDAGGKVSKTTTAAVSAPNDEQDASEPAAEAAPAAAPTPQKPIRKSVANARAELAPSAPEENSALAESTWPPLDEPAPSTTANNDNQNVAVVQPQPSVTDPSSTQSWTMASRWPEPNAAANERAVAPPQEPAQQAPALTADRLVTAANTTGAATTTDTAPTAAAATVTPQSQAETGTVSIGLLLSVLVGVLALAAIIGPVIFNYARPRKRREAPAARRPIWDTDAPDQTKTLFAQDEYRRQPVILDEPFEDQPIDETPRVTDTAVDEIEELLAQASRRSAA